MHRGRTAPFAQNCNPSSFIRAHQRGLLQLFSEVAIERSVPADNCLQRYSVDLGNIGLTDEVIPTCVMATVGTGRIVHRRGSPSGRSRPDRHT